MHEGSSSPTRDQTRAPCIGSTEFYPLDHQGVPLVYLDTRLVVEQGCFWWSLARNIKYKHYPYFIIEECRAQRCWEICQDYKEVSNRTSTICVLVYLNTMLVVVPMPQFPHL